jgi:putative FmdB family regulatory protein
MTYEYGCKVCGTHFETEQSIKDEGKAECPKCKVTCFNRLISGGNFVLKGDGWGKDLYSKGTGKLSYEKI